MGKGRLEAFSDGVIAIIITIMVLELKVPHDVRLEALAPLVPVFLSYVLSFVYLGIYWNNHHHLLHAVGSVGGSILWANLHLLFWLSLIPFTSAWMGENHLDRVPVALYGVVLLMNAVAFTILSVLLVRREGAKSKLARATGKDMKAKISLGCYTLAIPAALWVHPGVAIALYIIVAGIWIVPDRRIENVMKAG
jgi:uncharacterized membrane protein